MIEAVQFAPESSVPLYRQLQSHIRELILAKKLPDGAKLPPTRDLAGQLGLNRTTVSAAYDLLESEGLIRGHVGRGSFVQYPDASDERISFESSRPAEAEFPIADFRAACREVVDSSEAAAILQLGSPAGYQPLRQYLLEQAKAEGVLGPDDDLLITSGCQQALDLMQRSLLHPGDPVAIEDPVYHGIKHVFARGGARLVTVDIGPDGIGVEQLARVLAQERPRLLVLTPNFQNPTGATMPRDSRLAVLEAAKQFGVVVAENDIYRELRYRGESLATLKQLDNGAGTLLIRSFSKIAFPGLRVGWIIGPKSAISKMTEARQWCDLHTDQLSQAVLLRFACSGKLAEHSARVREKGKTRLDTVLAACARHLPQESTYTRPDGGMSLWVRLPEPLDASELLPRAQRHNVSYLPGKLFSVARYDPGTLRLSFGGLSPERIEQGLRRLGEVFREELERVRDSGSHLTTSALV